MSDRLLHWLWNGVVLGLIVILGAASLASIYLALLKLVGKRLDQGLTPLLCGVGLGLAVLLLTRHRADLVGDD
ncbi:MAG: hypothetical protein NZ561_06265 [Phycisphaerae bacterium]|nr:hypothetical protein [Phycisphaerae bacterium]MDW8263261.1 hypothetical protein [Phycisphaerales bacterium]